MVSFLKRFLARLRQYPCMYCNIPSYLFYCCHAPHCVSPLSLCAYSKSQAIQAQFVTALAAVAGTAVGLLAQRSEVLEELLLAFTAGGFLYLATVNMLPAIVRTPSSALQCALEAVCFAVGVGMMVAVTFLE